MDEFDDVIEGSRPFVLIAGTGAIFVIASLGGLAMRGSTGVIYLVLISGLCWWIASVWAALETKASGYAPAVINSCAASAAVCAGIWTLNENQIPAWAYQLLHYVITHLG